MINSPKNSLMSWMKHILTLRTERDGKEMTFYLAKTLDNIKMYGPIPDLSSNPKNVEEYVITEEENEWLLENLVDIINLKCDTLLDDGDYDFFDVEKCKVLLDLISNLPEGFVPKKHGEMIRVLKEFTSQAIEYNTGIAIEL